MAESEETETKEGFTSRTSDDQAPSISFPRQSLPNRPFDEAPLLQAVLENDGPMGVAESLDQAYTTLAEYLASDPNNAGQHNAHMLYVLRRLRNALLQGGGWH